MPVTAVQETGAELTVVELSVRRRLSFLDYMAGGCEIQCMLAVDFSSSNAPIDDPSSFHFAGIKAFRMQIQTSDDVCPMATDCNRLKTLAAGRFATNKTIINPKPF